MKFYVAHKNESEDDRRRAKELLRKLQVSDALNTYICPIFAFSYLNDGDIPKSDIIGNYVDLMLDCDAVFIASDGVKDERDAAHEWGLEVYAIET